MRISPAKWANALHKSVGEKSVAVLAVKLIHTVLRGHARLVQIPEYLLGYLYRRQTLYGIYKETITETY